MLCQKCQTQNPEDSRFCINCGANLLTSSSVPLEEEASVGPQTGSATQISDPTKGKLFKFGALFLVLVFLFVGGFFAYKKIGKKRELLQEKVSQLYEQPSESPTPYAAQEEKRTFANPDKTSPEWQYFSKARQLAKKGLGDDIYLKGIVIDYSHPYFDKPVIYYEFNTPDRNGGLSTAHVTTQSVSFKKFEAGHTLSDWGVEWAIDQGVDLEKDIYVSANQVRQKILDNLTEEQRKSKNLFIKVVICERESGGALLPLYWRASVWVGYEEIFDDIHVDAKTGELIGM